VPGAAKKAKKPVQKAAAKPRAAASPKKTAAAPARRSSPAKAPARKAPGRRPPKKSAEPLDLSAFPAESVRAYRKTVCLACILDVFTRHLNLALRTAWLEIRRYEPPVNELQEETFERPYFRDEDACPYCAAAAKWHAGLRIARIESGKATDAARRALLKSLPSAENQFLVVEEKATQQHAFYEWLDHISAGFDLDNPIWLRDVSLHYLSRLDPKTDWNEAFRGIHDIRRSRRLNEGWENDAGRLFLAPMLFDELLLVHYLVSRSQTAGGLTLEGRYPERRRDVAEVLLHRRPPRVSGEGESAQRDQAAAAEEDRAVEVHGASCTAASIGIIDLRPIHDATCTGRYSLRSAVSGSTRVARRAGNHTASIATAPSSAAAPASTTGSFGLTPYNNVRR
jgi:hypothetical protein